MKFKITAIIALICFSVQGVYAQIDRSEPPEPGPTPEINLGEPQTFKLNNGMLVMVVENHDLPKARMSITLDNKPHSARKKTGIKSLYSAMMGTGTQKLSKDKFNRKIEFYGANVGYGAGSAYASSLSRYFPEVVKLMAKGLLHPEFRKKEFKDQQDRLIEGVKASLKNASAIAGRVSQAIAYGKKHPYGEFATPESIKNVSLNNVKIYYEKYISPKNAYMVVVGDVEYDKIKEMVKKNFGSWDSSVPPETSLPTIPKVQYRQIDFVNISNAVQSELRIQNTVELEMNDKDYFSALIANQILGGGFGGYLNMALREERGFTYGAGSHIGTDQYASRFVASTSVRNEVTDSAIVEALDQIKKIRTEKASKEKIETTKAQFIGNFVMDLEDPATVARYALNIKIKNLPEDFYKNYLKNINAVTAENILNAAQEYIKMDQLQIVVAGKGADIAQDLEDITYNGKGIPVLYYNKKAERIEKQVYSKKVSDDISVADVYDQYLAAIGGKSQARKVYTIAFKAKAKAGNRIMNLQVKRGRKGRSYMKLNLAGMTVMKRVFDGQEGYVMSRGRKQPMPDKTIEEMKKNTELFQELSVPENAKLTGIQTVNGEEAYVVKIENTEYFYSVNSGLLLQEVTTQKRNGKTISSKSTFSNYKEVKGVKMPYTITRNIGPQTIQFKVENYKINSGVSAADFK